LIEPIGLDAEAFEHQKLFDAFEFSEEPFGFRDLVAAKQYRRLIGDGLDWLGLVRAVRSGRSASPAAACKRKARALELERRADAYGKR